MKRITAFIALLVTLVVCIAGFLIFHNHHTFKLSPEYYNHAEIADLTIDQLKSLIAEQKSFAVFAHQPGCQTSTALANIVRDFSNTHDLTFYQINFSELKDSGIVEGLRFYPTFVLFRAGQVASFLAADAEADVPAYSSLDGFGKWFTSYVRL